MSETTSADVGAQAAETPKPKKVITMVLAGELTHKEVHDLYYTGQPFMRKGSVKIQNGKKTKNLSSLDVKFELNGWESKWFFPDTADDEFSKALKDMDISRSDVDLILDDRTDRAMDVLTDKYSEEYKVVLNSEYDAFLKGNKTFSLIAPVKDYFAHNLAHKSRLKMSMKMSGVDIDNAEDLESQTTRDAWLSKVDEPTKRNLELSITLDNLQGTESTFVTSFKTLPADNTVVVVRDAEGAEINTTSTGELMVLFSQLALHTIGEF
jgi:hypothetical protein